MNSPNSMTADSYRAAAAEGVKEASRRLRGTLVASLADAVTGALAEADAQVLKFHGSYQQDDRDLREERRLQKLEPAHDFMIRTRLPGGVVTPRQWLQLDAIAGSYANGTLRLTTRQAFQFHGIIKRQLKATLQAINASLIDTVAACGDVNRNVVVAANPYESRAHAAVHDSACRLSEYLLPKTRAYYEIWLDEKQVAGSGEEDEPIYGPTYLPRKFKIAFAVPPVNDVDAFANDIGFIAIIEHGTLLGFNVVAGGGLGATHGDPNTYPRLADMLGFVAPDRVIATAEAIVTTQRDFGNRSDRKRARLKYTIDDRGFAWFKAEIERRAGFEFAPARPYGFDTNGDRFGWTEGEDGRLHLTLRIESGRIADRDGAPQRKGLREIARVHRGEFRLTQEFIRRYISWTKKLPRIAALNDKVIATGRAERGFTVDAISIHYEPLPQPISPITANMIDTYSLPDQRRDYMLKGHGEFSFPVPFTEGAGLYTVVVWVKKPGDRESIPASNVSIRVDPPARGEPYLLSGGGMR